MDLPTLLAFEEEEDAVSSRKRRLELTTIALLIRDDDREKKRNKVRARGDVVEEIEALDDVIFQRMYRLDRPRFYWILDLIKGDIATDDAMARVSSGLPVDPVIKLAVALRVAAGGSYLDIAFGYRIATVSVYKFFHEVFAAIDDNLKNINFPLDSDGLRYLQATFERFQGPAEVARTFTGTVAAGDGVVFRMQKPLAAETGGNVTGFYQRKGYYAYGMQGFCDGKCRFVYPL